ncbi:MULTISPECIES: ABC transporter permease [unclassified Imperialibacter]|uniref:ABC transporter permease n=1 Tax=unclassified Imperialibacter TaxID=2629706 RepID=UPI001252B3D2|nr:MULTISPECIES: ABC transporter permease [unclassified Imperialibacter]CAD5252481.1 putative ABC transport system permease protein [Imperialibacter sp. 89]CAD5260547.1 putative ABC transport system permease protein [Imperialibacter sp. 75]VVT04157.1 putative ABC transport system permease protein [Imperialibacter sp. EC-SDR9]
MKTSNETDGLPPRFGSWLLRRVLSRELLDEVQGDLTELYEDRRVQHGERYASLHYLKDCLLSIRNAGLRKQKKPQKTQLNSLVMISYYLKIALRNISKDRAFAAINILGLAVGVTCFLTLFLFVRFELSFDKADSPVAKNEQLYRVYVRSHINGESNVNSKTSGRMGATLKENFPEVLTYTRIGYQGPRAFRHNNRVYRSNTVHAVDSTFFDVFPVKFIEGEPGSALTSPNSLVITESAAKRIFGNENPVGATLETEGGRSYMVTALIEDFPKNSHFSCDYLESLSTYEPNDGWIELWYTTYIALKKGTDPVAFEKKMQSIVTNYVAPQVQQVLGVSFDELLKQGSDYAFGLQPFQSIYLRSQRDYGIDLNTEWGTVRSGDIAYIYIFSVVAVFILFIAVINFMNLSTAKSEKRAKEVGVRKTFGSTRYQLITQFISEAVLMSLLAVALSVVFIRLALPGFNNLTGRTLTFNLFSNVYTLPGLLLFALVVGVLAGSYPALYLSQARPISVLKHNKVKGAKSSKLRSSLVITQFAISISLLIGTIVIKDQLHYIQNKNLGFSREHLVSIRNAALLREKTDVFSETIRQNLNIQAITNSSRLFNSGIPGSGYLYNKKTGSDIVLAQFINVDDAFLETFQIELVAGRFFSKDFPNDSQAVIINESAARAFNAADPVGSEITSIDITERGTTYKIIGVVRDFNYESLHRQVRPLVLNLRPPRESSGMLTLRVSSDDMMSTMAFIEDEWSKLAPEGEAIHYSFVDETLARLYQSEQKAGTIVTIFASIAIFIACLGLFGLAAFVTERRTKEIGIRKVLGAGVPQIIVILSREFTMWVLLANLIAWPVSYLLLQRWLENFAFRIDISWYIFAGAGAAALLIALFTIGVHVIKTARANPVKALRYE